ncbi:hypothetical protein TNCV_2848371 [Trichonephila clavipes]|nr:hypothetical protein TNCV_2848371 [Trichonephila clavipes]
MPSSRRGNTSPFSVGLLVPTDDVISRVFNESSALEQVIAIHFGMAAEWAGLVSSPAKPVEILKKIILIWFIMRSDFSGVQKILELIFFATAVEKNVQQTVAAAMTIVTTCCFTFRSHPPLCRWGGFRST